MQAEVRGAEWGRPSNPYTSTNLADGGRLPVGQLGGVLIFANLLGTRKFANIVHYQEHYKNCPKLEALNYP